MRPEAPFAYEGLARIFHERGRLAVCTCLIANAGGMSFKALQEACALTDGNLNRHLHALAETGIVALERLRGEGRPTTIVRITEPGRRRFLAYIDELEAVVRAVYASEPERAPGSGLRLATSPKAGIGILTVYAFSEENWRREPGEISLLMELVRSFALREAEALKAQNVCVRAIGRTAALPGATRAAVDTLVAATASCDGLLLNLALNYGARSELCDAVRALALDVRSGELPLEAIDDDSLSRYLYTAGLPDPDLLIRTGGELRVSNFLLFQIAYAELWSTPVHWPAFESRHLGEALADFAKRQRRFGS